MTNPPDFSWAQAIYHPPASASRVLGLWACSHKPWPLALYFPVLLFVSSPTLSLFILFPFYLSVLRFSPFVLEAEPRALFTGSGCFATEQHPQSQHCVLSFLGGSFFSGVITEHVDTKAVGKLSLGEADRQTDT